MMPTQEYGIGAIAISVIGILFWVIKWMFQKGTKIIEKLNESVDANTKIQNETHKYLKNKNGQMEECFTKVINSQIRVVDKLDKIDKRYLKGRE